jgi:hypothetical protein
MFQVLVVIVLAVLKLLVVGVPGLLVPHSHAVHLVLVIGRVLGLIGPLGRVVFQPIALVPDQKR